LDFDLNKEQEMIRREVRRFAEQEIAPVAAELDKQEAFSEDLTRKMGEIGLFGMFVSEAYEGQEMDYLSYIIAVEEIARVDGSQAATIAAGNSLGIGPIYYFGSEAQKRKYLAPLCRGEGLWGFGLTEPTAGSDAGGSKTTAVRDGGQWILNGSKIFITNAACSHGRHGAGGHRHARQRQARVYLLSGGTRHAGVQGRGHEGQDDVAGLQYRPALLR
jgi:short/branched chain acyl-CoA dehydrogenase